MKSPKLLVLAATVLAIGGGLYFYWRHTAAHPASDDSYLQAGVLNITQQVSGAIVAVDATENQLVAQGDTLFTIDTSALLAAQQAAPAQLDAARQSSFRPAQTSPQPTRSGRVPSRPPQKQKPILTVGKAR
ncbi:MAG: biotin/lipoyl-binding protein [Yoonia sp.]|nr:biotin/lipoyl-binding protein [Yoonia sp.]MDG1863824.1 biotin/lipoyl-binding protein [Yoonia sp.]